MLLWVGGYLYIHYLGVEGKNYRALGEIRVLREFVVQQ